MRDLSRAAARLADKQAPYEVLEILPGLFRLPVPLPDNPLRELNAYLIRGKEGSLLIDTGFRLPPCRKAILQGLQAAGAEHDRLDVLLTHIHTDHTGQADQLAGPEGKIYLGEGDFGWTDQETEDGYWRTIDQRFLAEGFPKEELAVTTATNPARNLGPKLGLPNYTMLRDGDRLTVGDYTIEVIATPGHTPGQVCLWIQAEGILFTADHVLFDITPNIALWPNLPNALGRYLESLEKIRAYPVRLALPGHRHTGELEGRIQALFAHHKNRVAETRSILQKHPGLTAYQIAARMTWDIRAKNWDAFPLNQKWFATGEALSHLEYLMEAGQAARTRDDGGVAHYHPL